MPVTFSTITSDGFDALLTRSEGEVVTFLFVCS